MKKLLAASLGLLGLLAAVQPADAHFMVAYNKDTYMEKAKDLDMRMVFTHPSEAGTVMNMGGVKEFYALHQRGDSDVKKIDFLKNVKEITWKNGDSKAPAYKAQIKAKDIRSLGDYVFVFTPGYYHEEEEGVYMQQITKLILNVGGIPGNWNQPAGLPAEIVPMIKPYGLWTGNVFQGQVLSNGKPVANAEVEVEFMSNEMQLDSNTMSSKCEVEYPAPQFVTQTIFTDENGVFTFGIPRAGWWGFAALGVGPDKEYKGKELSQDAVIWVQAVDMK